MAENSFLIELQKIQSDLSRGIKTLGEVEQLLSEEPLPNPYSDALYVVHTFLRGIHKKLAQCVWAYEQSTDF